ncbi:M23 family metallopeptidase [Phytohalomonas tamaricis]|uniref:M23 family metallopeptidase n=1 Tax=Phytohalomonas tamaricis TaxID=2081032 RepID=UPI000D0B3FA5|nr:M23 family metallopeptidase [Phytohalomonas tamaricis]
MAQRTLARQGQASFPLQWLILAALLVLGGCAGSVTSSSGGWVTVQRGDTLHRLARQGNIPLLRLQRFNPGVNATDLRIGQRLLMPTPQERAPGSGAYRYQIRPGDTYGNIAAHFGTSVARLSAANSGLDPRNLRIGQLISIPMGSGSVSKRQQIAKARQSPPAPLPKGVGNWPWPLTGGHVRREFGPDARGSLQPMLIEAGDEKVARAVASGTVKFAGGMRQLGEVVIIHHAHNLQTVYAQCNHLEITEGVQVKPGTPLCRIGRNARTGRYDLLFDTRNAGKPVDPRRLLR